MGNARWSGVDWTAHQQTTSHQSRSQIFSQQGMHPDLDPSKFKKREAVDSAANPNSTPIIIASDVTGSMGYLAEQIIKTELGPIMELLYAKKPVPDPQICAGAIGDAYSDTAPLQVTQFEADISIAEQMKKIYLEGNGGGNGGESYPLVWAFAGYKTRCDRLRKQRGKGYIFTIGDECPHPTIRRDDLRHFLGLPAEADMRVDVLLADVQKDWNVFHLMVNPVHDQPVVDTWKKLLGERAILVKDTKYLASGIVGVIQCIEEHSSVDLTQVWSGSTAVALRQVDDDLIVR